jgi:hypothetical protein
MQDKCVCLISVEIDAIGYSARKSKLRQMELIKDVTSDRLDFVTSGVPDTRQVQVAVVN